MIEEKIVKRNGKFFVMSEDGTKKLGGPFDTRDEAVKRLSQVEGKKKQKESFGKKFVWEVKNYHIEEKEEGDSKFLVVEGTALDVGVSKNNRDYSFENLKENNGASFNWLVGHKDDYDNPDHNVGDGSFSLTESSNPKLDFKGRVMNTSTHPDIVTQVKEGLVAPSIQGYGDVKSVKERHKFVIKNLKIPLIALVNKHTRGVGAASIQAAIAESFINEMDDVEQSNKNNDEVNKMVEENKESEKIKNELKEKSDELQKLKESIEKSKKESLVNSIMELNKDLKKETLMETSESELKIIMEYEKKISEQEDKHDAGDANMETSSSEDTESDEENEESLKGIVFNEKDGSISMSDKKYKQFNKSIMENIYK